MGPGLPIACGLGAALCFGTGDYLAQQLTHRHGWLPAVLAVQIGSAMLLAIVAPAWHGLPSLDASQALVLAAIGLANTAGMVGLYRAFEVGALSLVSPIAGSMGAFTVVFAWAFGEPPELVVLAGLAAVTVGIVVASIVRRREDDGPRLSAAAGVGWALLSAVSFGGALYFLAPSSAALGPAWAVLGLRIVAALSFVLLARVRREPAIEPAEARASVGRTAAVAALDSGGMVLYALGSSAALASGHSSQVATVAVLASAFPLITVVWAQIRAQTDESLAWWQWAGVAAVLLGVAWTVAHA